MLAKVKSCGLLGLEAYPITIEVDVSRGLPAMTIVGLPDNAVKESRERVRSAIKNSGYHFSPQRVTVNLSPADIKKEGSSWDVAIAVGLLAATEQISPSCFKHFIILGELSLDGGIRPVKGSLAVALACSKKKCAGLILPAANAQEAAMVEDVPVFPVNSLSEVVHFLNNPESIPPLKTNRAKLFENACHYDVDFGDVKGQSHAKRGLEVAAAGGHNVLLVGPPGSGKTMLAKRLTTILPDITLEEALETTQIHSALGLTGYGQGIIATRPFRSPHHTSSDVALVGGGSNPKPGEISLAHNGILFLDELPEYNRNVLESLRQPIEDGHVSISRASKSIRFPSKFMLVCAMNPCPCGWHTDPKKECSCTPQKIQRYLSKISGPLLDRIDIHLEIPALRYRELLDEKAGESSSDIKKRASRARLLQKKRFGASSIYANAQMHHKQIKAYCPLSVECKELLKTAIDELGLSARAHDKILKVSRTISDLAGSENILPEHIAEAVQYRSLDRNFLA